MEISREEKIRTIKLARQMMQNMMAQYFPEAEMKEYLANREKLYGRQQQPQPEETAEERQRLEAILADARSRREMQ